MRRAAGAVSAMMAGTPVRFRKRGAELQDAILAAAFDELIEVGFAAFSIESVALRAKTGKGSIYRRWPTKEQLILDAFSTGLPDAEVVCGPGLVCEDTTTRDALVQIYSSISAAMAGGAGQMMCAIVAELNRGADSEFLRAIDERIVQPRRDRVLALLQRGVQRGEVRPDAVTDLVGEVGPAVIMHRRLTGGNWLNREDIEDLVDSVVMPMLRPVDTPSAPAEQDRRLVS